MEKKIPITIINGYLGSGKTTLLKHILTNEKGFKVALIVNDLAELNVDSKILQKNLEVTQASDQLIELSNGCICCDLKSDLVNTIGNFINKGTYDYILVESSGITEPIPVAQSLVYGQFSDGRLLQNHALIDSMITVVDAYRLKTDFNLGDDLVSHQEKKEHHNDADDENYEKIDGLVVEQIEFSNIIILNKVDLVSSEELIKIKDYINLLQPGAIIYETTFAQVDLDKILNVNIFDAKKMISRMGWVQALTPQEEDETNHHDEHHDHEHEEHHDHEHDEHCDCGHHDHEHHHHHNHGEHYGISSFVYRKRRPFHAERLSIFYNELPKSIIRSKGIVWLADDNKQSYMLSQAGKSLKFDLFGEWLAANDEEMIQRTLENNPSIKANYDAITGDRINELVVIGVNMNHEDIRKKLDWVLLTEDEFELIFN